MDAGVDRSARSIGESEADEAWAMLVLREMPGLGPVRIKALLGRQEGGWATTALALRAQLRDRSLVLPPGTPVPTAKVLADAEAKAESIVSASRRHGVSVVPLTSLGYPPALAEIHDPPPVLFARGALPTSLMHAWETLRTVAVVGTRDPTARARRWAEEAGRDLAMAGTVVVSGLARGIDGAAHEGAVSVGAAPAVAVLAGGPDVVRPAVHQRLSERIVAEGGALLSEAPPGAPARPHDFVARNRIVSGLARGVVVVEAGARSGALHTADFALEQGRTLFVVPDHPTSTRAQGNLRLLREGAIPVLGAEQILEEMGWGDLRAIRALQPTDRAWLERVADRAPCPVDALAGDPVEVTIALTKLEVEGLVDRDGSGRYRLSSSGRRALASER